MNNRKPRFTICTITTIDTDLVALSDEIRIKGYTHEYIYKRGLKEIEKEISQEKIN